MKRKIRPERFENLEVWKEGCDLAVEIYKLAREGELRRDYGLKDQMTRSAVSIPSNVAEGKERETVPELVRYLFIAKGSAGELRTHLHIAHRIGYIEEPTFHNLLQKTQILSRKLGGFIQSLRRKRKDP
jgi:four helix bundle protein